MPAGEQADQQPLNQLFLADKMLGHFPLQQPNPRRAFPHCPANFRDGMLRCLRLAANSLIHQFSLLCEPLLPERRLFCLSN